MVKNKKCLCCKGRVITHPAQKYCTSCSLYLRNYRSKLSYAKCTLRNRNKLLWGTSHGNQRLRENDNPHGISAAMKKAYLNGYRDGLKIKRHTTALVVKR